MLILSRRAEEWIYLDLGESVDPEMTVKKLFAEGPIEILVSEIRGNQVRLGFAAPKALDVYRDELVE